MSTVTTPLNENLHFVQFVTGLLDLRDLADRGIEDSDEVDEIHANMERAWWKLPDEDQELLNGLSGDLYSELSSPRSPEQVPDAVTRQFEAARDTGNWRQVLVVLREHEAILPPVDVATLRGICWENLGFPTVARMFFRAAMKLAPSDPTAEVFYVQSFLLTEDWLDILAHAQGIVASKSGNAPLLLVASMVLLCSAQTAADPDEILTKGLDALERGISLAQGSLFPGLDYLVESSKALYADLRASFGSSSKVRNVSKMARPGADLRGKLVAGIMKVNSKRMEYFLQPAA